MCQHMECWLLITAVNESWVINIALWAVEEFSGLATYLFVAHVPGI